MVFHNALLFSAQFGTCKTYTCLVSPQNIPPVEVILLRLGDFGLNLSKNSKDEVRKGAVPCCKLSGPYACPTTVGWNSALWERALRQLGHCSYCSAAPQQAEYRKQESPLKRG